MRRVAAVLVLLTAFAAIVVAGEGTVFTVQGDEVRFRAGPGTLHPVLGTLARGDRVVVVGSEGRWKEVRVPGGFACFVHAELVTTGEDGVATVKAERVLLRATAGKDHAPLSRRLGRGDELTVLGTEGDWVRVISPADATAWIFEDLLKEQGPAGKYGEALAREAAKRRSALLGDDPGRREKRTREERRKAVLEIGGAVLGGKGDAADQRARLEKIALESDDDLTSGYANALLSLLALRSEAEDLEARLAEAEKQRAEEVEKVREMLAKARKLYEDARKRAEAMKTRREKPYRAVGTIEKRGEGFVLVEGGKVLFRLESKSFRLADYVGKRVGVNGRMMVTDADEGRSHLLVEKMEILPGKSPERPGR